MAKKEHKKRKLYIAEWRVRRGTRIVVVKAHGPTPASAELALLRKLKGK